MHSDFRRACNSVQKAKEQPVCETSAEYGILQEQREVQITSKSSQGMERCRVLRNAAYEACKWAISWLAGRDCEVLEKGRDAWT